jgi:hypothetical protein
MAISTQPSKTWSDRLPTTIKSSRKLVRARSASSIRLASFVSSVELNDCSWQHGVCREGDRHQWVRRGAICKWQKLPAGGDNHGPHSEVAIHSRLHWLLCSRLQILHRYGVLREGWLKWVYEEGRSCCTYIEDLNTRVEGVAFRDSTSPRSPPLALSLNRTLRPQAFKRSACWERV